MRSLRFTQSSLFPMTQFLESPSGFPAAVHARVLRPASLSHSFFRRSLLSGLSMLITAIRYRCYHFALDPLTHCSYPEPLSYCRSHWTTPPCHSDVEPLCDGTTRRRSQISDFWRLSSLSGSRRVLSMWLFYMQSSVSWTWCELQTGTRACRQKELWHGPFLARPVNTSHAAAFWIICRGLIVFDGSPARRALQ